MRLSTCRSNWCARDGRAVVLGQLLSLVEYHDECRPISRPRRIAIDPSRAGITCEAGVGSDQVAFRRRSAQPPPIQGALEEVVGKFSPKYDRDMTSRLHPADSHDLIRVQGARENNLKDVSVEIPKRRLTVFTGVSGSGKSSLVFGTIAAESQRLINETYSAFVQGFMPTLGRPEVDVLEGLTTAIIVDQERMGANSRSTVGTVTDANAMLRVLWSRLGKPHVGSSNAFSFNIPSVRAVGSITVEKGAPARPRRSPSPVTGGMCPRCEGYGVGHRHRPVPVVRRQQVAQRRGAHDPGLHGRRLAGAHLRRPRASTRTSRSRSTRRRSARTFSIVSRGR